MNKQYEIITNSKGRRILVINEIFDVEKEQTIAYEDFDAVYLNITYISPSEFTYNLQLISPFQSNKCWIKPRFSRNCKETNVHGITYLLDGLAETPTDAIITNRIEEIYERIQRFKTPRYPQNLHSHTQLCLRLCNYCFVREFLEFPTTSSPYLATGFTLLFNVLFYNREMNTRNAMFDFVEKLISHKFVTKVRHFDKVHLCPSCHTPHLFFIECCPKCGSSDISQQSVIHHFRCANVSPESTYEYDGQLRCPKCKQYVRHIGVDYDRPADIYNCNHCNHTFLNSDMKAQCSECGKICKPSELQPHDINLYRFTEEAIRFIPKDEAIMVFAQDIWNGYTPFDTYLKQLRWSALSTERYPAIIAVRFRLGEPGLNTTSLQAFTHDLHVSFYQYNFTTQGKYFYLTHRCHIDEEIEQYANQMSEDISNAVAKLINKYSTEISYLDKHTNILYAGENVEEFIRELTSITPPSINKN